MAYRRRENPITKTCKKCKAPFETWHIGRIYCGQACNMTAWRHRHKKKLKSTGSGPHLSTPANSSALGKLSFSLPDIVTIATGSLAATAVTALLSNDPSQREVIDLIKSLSQNVGRSMGGITERLNMLDDFVKSVASGDPVLQLKIQSRRQRRLSSGKP